MFSYITLTRKNEVLSVALPLPPLCEPSRTSYETIRSTWTCLDQLLQFLCILLCSLCCKLCTSFFPIMQMGSHKELLRNEGLYARLTRRQADAVAWRCTNFGLSSLFFFQLIYEQLSGSSNIFTADLTKGYLGTRKLHHHFYHHENARKPRCLEAF